MELFIYDAVYKSENIRIITPLDIEDFKDFANSKITSIKRATKRIKKIVTIDYFAEITKHGTMGLLKLPESDWTIDKWVSKNTDKIDATLQRLEKFRVNVTVSESENSEEDELELEIDLQDSRIKHNKDYWMMIQGWRVEEPILRLHINYYLEDLGLNKINIDSLVDIDDLLNPTEGTIYAISTWGDLLTGLSFEASDIDSNSRKVFLSNDYQRSVLVRMGYTEFSLVEEHLAGTFFEVLVATAYIQGNHEVYRRLINELLGECNTRYMSEVTHYFE